MTASKPTNMAASVRQRLMNHALKAGEDYQTVLTRYGCERLLYRLSLSPYASQLTLKGALMFLVWTGEQYRPTKDMDLTAARKRTADELATMFKALCGIAVEDDGVRFLPDTVEAEPIREENEYGGMRVTLMGKLGQAGLPLQVDIGFGDAITPRARQEDFPVLLGFPAPHLAMYPRESAVAEKFETMVRRGLLNSRMKDYYDIWALAQTFDFDGDLLQDALRATFKRRKTDLPTEVPAGLSDEFSADAAKQKQWTAFTGRTRLKFPQVSLPLIVQGIRDFLMPVVLAAHSSSPFGRQWTKGKAWRD